jgi:hypothetical protein
LEVKLKKLFLVMLLVSVCAAGFSSITQFGMGADVGGKHKVKVSINGSSSGSSTYDVAIGFSPYAEIMGQSGNLLYGIGAEYQVPRNVTFNDGSESTMNFIPVYGVARIKLSSGSGYNPELIAQGGLNLFAASEEYKGDADLKGGMYWGLGAGLVVDKLVLQLIYKVNTGTIEQDYLGDTIKADVTNSQFNLSGGIRF